MTDTKESDVLECRDNMYITVFRILKNREDSEDAVQDAICRAIAKLHQFDPDKANLSTWCCTIAKNYALQLIRERKKMGYQTYTYTRDEERNVETHNTIDLIAADDSEYQDVTETYEKVIQLIKEHPGLSLYGLNDAFIDYYLNKGVVDGVQGKKYEDLAAEYGVHAGTIRTVFRRASSEIRKKFMRQNKLF